MLVVTAGLFWIAFQRGRATSAAIRELTISKIAFYFSRLADSRTFAAVKILTPASIPSMPVFNQAPGGGGAAPAVGRIPVDGRSAVAESKSKTARPIRLALVLYRDDLNLGGSLRVVEILANALDPARVEAHIVFAYGGPGPIAGRSNVPCHFLNSRGPLDVKSWWRSRSVMDGIDPDIVHFHNPAYWLHVALIGKKYKKLFHLHGPFFPDQMGRFQRWLMERTSRLGDATVCITRDMRRMVLQLGWGEPDRTWTVYNGIDCNGFGNRAGQTRSPLRPRIARRWPGDWGGLPPGLVQGLPRRHPHS